MLDRVFRRGIGGIGSKFENFSKNHLLKRGIRKIEKMNVFILYKNSTGGIGITIFT
jgi:hypothetical protein